MTRVEGQTIGRRRVRRMAAGAFVFVAVVGAFGVVAALPAYADCSQPIDVQTTGDACGDVAVSVMGNASGEQCDSGVGQTGCVAVSGTGNASNSNTYYCGLSGLGCVAVSGTGNASNSGIASNGCGTEWGLSCLAVSGTGDASNDVPYCSSGCVAVSGTGTASNSGPAVCGYDAYGCVAISGTGNSSNNAQYCGSTNSESPGIGCVAISGTGNASNNADYCGHPFTSSPSFGCVAVSGTGDASNNARYDCGSSEMVPSAGCVAVSGMGNASNTAGSCVTGCVAVCPSCPAPGLATRSHPALPEGSAAAGLAGLSLLAAGFHPFRALLMLFRP